MKVSVKTRPLPSVAVLFIVSGLSPRSCEHLPRKPVTVPIGKNADGYK